MPANIDIFINGKDQTGPAIASAKSGLAGLGSSAADTQSKFSAMTVAVGTAIGNLAAGAISKIGGLVTSVVSTGFEFNNMAQQAEIAFTTMLGSGQMAKSFLDELQAFAAQTPFEFPELTRAAQRMLAMGFEANQVLPTLTAIGDAVAGLGGSSEMVDRVTTALGQMQAKGKATGEEMMQLTEAGIPAWEFLAEKIGVSIPDAMKMVSQGAVSADVAIGALVDGMNTKFGGLMEKQSATFGGLLSTIQDTFAQISGKVMGPAFDAISQGLKMVVDWTSTPSFNNGVTKVAQLVGKFFEWGMEVMPPLIDGFVKFLDWMGQAIQVAKDILRPVADAIAKFVGFDDVLTALGILMGGPLRAAFGGIVVGLAQFLAPIAAVVAAVAAVRWAWENDFGGIRTFTLDVVRKISDWFYKESGIWKGTWEETWAHIAQRVDKFIRLDIYNFIVGTWAEIKEKWRFHTTKIRDQTEAWIDDLIQTLTHWKDVAIETFNQWKDKTLSAFNKFFDPIKKDVTDWATITKSEFDQWVIYLTGKFTQWKDDMIARFQPVFDWWDKHIDPWIQKGKDLIQGFWDGIKQKWQSFKDWAGDTFQGWIDWFDRLFDFGSPSKLFDKRGQWIMEGLGNGLKAYARVPISEVESMTNSITAQMERLKGAVVQNVFDLNDAVKQLNLNPATMPEWMGGTGKVIGLGPNGELILEGINKLPVSTIPTPAPAPVIPTNTIGSAVGGNQTAGGTAQDLLGGITLTTPDIESAQASAKSAAAKVADFIAGLGDFLSNTVENRTMSKVFHNLDDNLSGLAELRTASDKIRTKMADLLDIPTMFGGLSDNLGAVMEKISAGTDLEKVAGLLQAAVDFRTLSNFYSTSDYANVLPDDARLTGGNTTTNNFTITLQGSSNIGADVMGLVELLGSLQGAKA